MLQECYQVWENAESLPQIITDFKIYIFFEDSLALQSALKLRQQWQRLKGKVLRLALTSILRLQFLPSMSQQRIEELR